MIIKYNNNNNEYNKTQPGVCDAGQQVRQTAVYAYVN